MGDEYGVLRIPEDRGLPPREEIARLIYSWDAITDEQRTRGDYLAVADNVLEFLTRRAALS
jgi:hypothetical protein